jgi:uncharacterized protein YecT (DUF1311 family)
MARINEAVETTPNELPKKNLQDEMDRMRAETALAFITAIKGVLTNFDLADKKITDTYEAKLKELEEAKRKEFTLSEEEVAALKKLLDKVKESGADVTPASSTSSETPPPAPSKPLVKLEGID